MTPDERAALVQATELFDAAIQQLSQAMRDFAAAVHRANGPAAARPTSRRGPLGSGLTYGAQQ